MTLASATLPSTACIRTNIGSGASTMTTQTIARGRASDGASVDTRDIDLDRLGAYLRRQHPFDTAYKVSQRLADAGHPVPEATVKNWLQCRNQPTGENLVRIVSAYGPRALAAAYPDGAPDWIEAQGFAERQQELERRIAALEAERLAVLEALSAVTREQDTR